MTSFDVQDRFYIEQPAVADYAHAAMSHLVFIVSSLTNRG